MFERIQERQVSTRRYWARMATGISVGLGVTVGLWKWQQRQDEERRVQASVDRAKADPVLHAERRTYERMELPGMSLEVPMPGTPSGNYGDGSVSARFPIGYEIVWSAGVYDEKSREHFVRSWQSAVIDQASFQRTGLAPVKLGGVTAAQYRFADTHATFGPIEATLTFGACDGRNVVIVVTGRTGVGATTERMVDSFQCKPDPNAKLFEPTVVVAARPGWTLANKYRLVLMNAHKIVVQANRLDDTDGSVADAIKQLSGPMGVVLDKRVGTRGDKVFWRGVMGPDRAQVAILGWRCGESRDVGTVVVIGREDSSLDEGIALADTGRCLKPGEQAPAYPIE